MSTLARSHNVCTGCRSRKKKCNGERPSCSSCSKRGDFCFYAGAPSQALGSVPSELFPISDNQENLYLWNQLEQDTGCHTVTGLANCSTGYDILHQGVEILPGSSEFFRESASQPTRATLPTPPSQSSTPPYETLELPPHEQLQQLVDIYFEKVYETIPILHKPTILSKLQSRDYEDSSLLFFSIIAVTASAHPNREIQQSQKKWLNGARNLFSKAIHSSDNELQTIIAANFIIYQCMIAREPTEAWVTLGEAWRLAVSAGYNIQDGQVFRVPSDLGPKPCNSWIDMEQCRRSVWMLFIFDRGMCFLIGLAHAIDDRQLRINFPMDEDNFQATTEPSSLNPIKYTSNLDRLITIVQEQTRTRTTTLLQFIVLAYIFLGRVSEQIYALDHDLEEQKAHLDSLTCSLLRIRLMLPRSATDLSAADYRDFSYVVWLNVIMSVSTILLYHKPLHEGETLDDQTELSTNWPHCVSAARGTVAMIRDVSRTATNFVINPHISPKLFICGRILVMEYICPSMSKRNSSGVRTRDPTLRDDLRVLVFTFERVKEALQGVGRKFRNGLIFYLQDDEDYVRQGKAGGPQVVLQRCEKWANFNGDADATFLN